MAANRKELVMAAYRRAFADTSNYGSLKEGYEFRKQTILTDESLTKDEKSEVIKWVGEDFDTFKIRENVGTKRICENCKVKCLATLYCEHCVRNYLKANFSKWTSGN